MRKALIVGIDYYVSSGTLTGCVRDALEVKTVLERHADGTINFATPNVLTSSGVEDSLTRRHLRDAIEGLFADDSEVALFYFSGHGDIDNTGGFLCTSDTQHGDDGVSLTEVLTLANQSSARNKVIVLDSCHSGIAATNLSSGHAEISDGTTILTASSPNQYAYGGGGGGTFTNLFVDALYGSAANLVGEVTPGSIYAHIDQSLGPWAQRPVFKTNVTSFVSLRKCEAPIALNELQMICELFPAPQHRLALDPAYEPTRSESEEADPAIPGPDPAKTAHFRVLQNYVKVSLVRPVDAEHMYFAAMNGTACELTVLGQHYWNLVDQGLI